MLLRGPALTCPCRGPGRPRFAVKEARVPSLPGYPELQESAGQRAVYCRELDRPLAESLAVGILASTVGGLKLLGPPSPCSWANVLGPKAFILLVLLWFSTG